MAKAAGASPPVALREVGQLAAWIPGCRVRHASLDCHYTMEPLSVSRPETREPAMISREPRKRNCALTRTMFSCPVVNIAKAPDATRAFFAALPRARTRGPAWIQ